MRPGPRGGVHPRDAAAGADHACEQDALRPNRQGQILQLILAALRRAAGEGPTDRPEAPRRGDPRAARSRPREGAGEGLGGRRLRGGGQG